MCLSCHTKRGLKLCSCWRKQPCPSTGRGCCWAVWIVVLSLFRLHYNCHSGYRQLYWIQIMGSKKVRVLVLLVVLVFEGYYWEKGHSPLWHMTIKHLLLMGRDGFCSQVLFIIQEALLRWISYSLFLTMRWSFCLTKLKAVCVCVYLH